MAQVETNVLAASNHWLPRFPLKLIALQLRGLAILSGPSADMSSTAPPSGTTTASKLQFTLPRAPSQTRLGRNGNGARSDNSGGVLAGILELTESGVLVLEHLVGGAVCL
jgi:hypothetical protein